MVPGKEKYTDKLVSIIMPAYNAEKNIIQAIDSVLAQSYKNWELIVINDCSTDRTLEILKQNYLVDSRIKIYSLQKNSGVAAARNFGINLATGRFLAFLDSDDIWLEFKLELQLKEMKNNEEIYFCVSPYYKINDSSQKIERPFMPKKKINFKDQLLGSEIGCLTVVIDRYVVSNIEMPNVGHEDYVTWTFIIKEYGPAHSLNIPTAIYRKANNSISSNKLKSAYWQWSIYRNIFKFSWIKSILYFMSYTVKGLRKNI